MVRPPGSSTISTEYFLFKEGKDFRAVVIVGGRMVSRTARFGKAPYLLSASNVPVCGKTGRATPDEAQRWLADVYCVIDCVNAEASTLGDRCRGSTIFIPLQ